MKVAIVGSRGFKALHEVKAFVRDRLAHADVIVTGGAYGVDTAAMEAAKQYGRSMLVHYPDWTHFGKKAGYLRNMKIIEDADVVVAFWDGLSKGTEHAIMIAKKDGKAVQVFVEDEEGVISEVDV